MILTTYGFMNRVNHLGDESFMRLGNKRYLRGCATAIICISMLVASCGGSAGSKPQGKISELFLAADVVFESNEYGDFTINDIMVAEIKDSLVPTTRLSASSEGRAIAVYLSLDESKDYQYYGYPQVSKDEYLVWSFGNGNEEIVKVNVKTGEKSRVLSGESIRDVKFFDENKTLIANTDDGVCFGADESYLSKRIGKGRCAISNGQIFLVDNEETSTRISKLGKDLLPAASIVVPLKSARVMRSGLIAQGLDDKGDLAFYSMADGSRLWKSDAGVQTPELLAEAESTGTWIVGIDADDDDERIDVVRFSLEENVLKTETLLSSPLASAWMSSDGGNTLIATRDTVDSTMILHSHSAGAGVPSVVLPNEKIEKIAIGSAGQVVLMGGGSFYLGSLGEELTRVGDLFGDVDRVIFLRDSDKVLVPTTKDGQYEILMADKKVSGFTQIAKGDGVLRVSDTSLLKNGKFVFLSRESDGYSVISEVSLSEEAELKRIAEGRIGYYVLNEAGELFYAEVNAPTFTFYRQKSADRASREQLSTQQILLRQGSSGVDTYFPDVPWFMEAFVDPVLKQCKVDGVPIVKLGVEQTVPVGTNGAVSSEFCIQVPKESQGAEFSIAITGDVDTALSGNSYDVDDVELYDSANVYLETSGDPLLQRVTLSESSYRFQLASWNGAGKALVRFNLADATDTRQIYTIRFDQSRWEESESNRLACNAGSTLRSGKKISVTANVDSYGYAQETAFCVYQGPLHSNQLLIAGQNTSERIGASIYCSSLNNGSSIRYTYAQNDTYRNESFPIFYRSDKGLRSCTLRNYFDKPASNTKYSSTFTLVFNLVENSLADIRD